MFSANDSMLVRLVKLHLFLCRAIGSGVYLICLTSWAPFYPYIYGDNLLSLAFLCEHLSLVNKIYSFFGPYSQFLGILGRNSKSFTIYSRTNIWVLTMEDNTATKFFLYSRWQRRNPRPHASPSRLYTSFHSSGKGKERKFFNSLSTSFENYT